MKIVVCLDDCDGMQFNSRRQSKDCALRNRLLQITASATLWMNPYSASQFNGEEKIAVDEAFLDKAQREDYCFVENTDISAYADRVTGVIIYRWNRTYPRDVVFPLQLFSDKWSLISRKDFPGNSHERITEEVYTL